MTQREFEERTKMVVTADEFDIIHELYMACGDKVDKDEFCKLYLTKSGRHTLMDYMAQEKRIADDAYSMAMGRIKELECERREADSRMADWLMEQAEKWSATDLRDRAIEMLGAREYLRRKIERKMNLWKADRELLVSLLTKE